MDVIHDFVLDFLPRHAITRRGTLSAAVGEDHDGEDRISALTDDLLRLIVSRLPIKDAVRTTLLSSRWRRIWPTTPLVLYDAHLVPASEDAFVAAVDRILAGHPGPLRTVHLAHCIFGAHEREIAQWSRLLAAGGVRDLVFVNKPPPWAMHMPLPADIICCTELRHLYLGFWSFPDTAGLPGGADVFPHLREFVILNTHVEGRDLDHMLASSPELETLVLVVSSLLPKHVRLRGQNLQRVLFWDSMAVELSVVDTPRLKRLIMRQACVPCRFDESDEESRMVVRIACAPELKVLGYLEPKGHKLQIGNTVIEADTKASPSSMVPSVKILALKVDLSVSAENQMLASFLRCFPNVETLHVEFEVPEEPEKHYGKILVKLHPIECVHSSINEVVLHEFRGNVNEVIFLVFLTERVNLLQKLTIVLSKEIRLPVDYMKALLNKL